MFTVTLTLFELNILHLCGFDNFQFIFFLVCLIIFISYVCRGRGRERDEVKGGGGGSACQDAAMEVLVYVVTLAVAISSLVPPWCFFVSLKAAPSL